MPGKDEFTFDDNDDFPETDLSSAFSEGEHEAPAAVAVEPSPKKKRGRGGKKPDGGGSKSKVLLLVLLLIVAGGAGVYYFMDLGGTTPIAPKTAPAKKAKQTVALPPKPAAEPVQQMASPASAAVPAPAKAETEQDKVVDAVPPAKEVAPVPTPTNAETPPKVKTEAAPEKAKVAVAVPPEPEAKPEVAVGSNKPQPVSSAVPGQTPATLVEKPAVKTSPVQKPTSVATGPYVLDAGSYLLASNREILVQKIKSLGYEPQITAVEATLSMTRLRLGHFPEGEAQEALAFARTIEPAAFSVRDGDQYVIYAGTYLQKSSIEKLSQRFLQEGIQTEAVPVKVVRTLSRIHFGGFASRADAEAVAQEAKAAGFQAEVINVK